MKLVLATVLVAIAPSPAPAQSVRMAPPPVFQPAPSQPRIATMNSRGITVNGSDTVLVKATSARITLQLASADNRLTLDRDTVQPLVDALVSAGASHDSLQLPFATSAGAATNQASISATVEHPTIQQMRSGIISVGGVVAGMKNVRLLSAQVELVTDNCASATASARGKALANARAKADEIAKQLHVGVGNVLSVQAFDQNTSDGACRAQYFVGPMGPQFPFGSSSTDDDYISVRVYSNVTITYAIK